MMGGDVTVNSSSCGQIAALTRSGARKASEIVMLTLRNDYEGEPERIRNLHVEDQLDSRRQLDRQIRRPLALENAAGVGASQTERISKSCSIAHKTAGLEGSSRREWR
jgi:hypothetical protein